MLLANPGKILPRFCGNIYRLVRSVCRIKWFKDTLYEVSQLDVSGQIIRLLEVSVGAQLLNGSAIPLGSGGGNNDDRRSIARLAPAEPLQDLDAGDSWQIEIEDDQRGTVRGHRACESIEIPQGLLAVGEDMKPDIETGAPHHFFNDKDVGGIVFNEQHRARRLTGHRAALIIGHGRVSRSKK